MVFYKNAKCRYCKHSYNFKYFWNVNNDIETKCKYNFCCIHEHEIYSAEWIP